MGQVVTRRSHKNMFQGHISGYEAFQGLPYSGADLYRKQTNKVRIVAL